MSEEQVCEECGNDLAAEGHPFCLECLEAGAATTPTQDRSTTP